MKALTIKVFLITFTIFFFSTSLAYAEEAKDIESSVFVAPEREDVNADDLEKLVDDLEKSSELKITFIAPSNPEPNARELIKEVMTDSEYDLGIVYLDDEVLVSQLPLELVEESSDNPPEQDTTETTEEDVTQTSDEEDESKKTAQLVDPDLQPYLDCATEKIKPDEDLDVKLTSLITDFAETCRKDQSKEVPSKDVNGAENIVYVLNQIDDGVYVGDTRKDIDEVGLEKVVGEIRTTSELRLIVVAPDNPQPSPTAFARRLHDLTKSPVLLFDKDDRAVSYVFEDKTEPRSAYINRFKRNQACATKAVWEHSDEVRATEVFADRLLNGCPFQPPAFFMVIAGIAIGCIGVLGVAVVKERDSRNQKKLKLIMPPEESDRVETKQLL